MSQNYQSNVSYKQISPLVDEINLSSCHNHSWDDHGKIDEK